jgi:predicted phage-related endonuclease
MQILPVDQGSAEWLDVRARYACASEAPIIMGASSKTSRNDFLKMKANGSEREFSAYVRGVILEAGHEAEAAARSLVETLVGEELYPIVGVHDEEPFLASFDGMTIACDRAMEHKLYNEALAAQVRAKELSPEFYWQLEHECYVAGLAEILFVVSDGTPDHFVTMTYASVPDRRAQLLAGWEQFDEDLRAYRHVTEPMPAAVIAKPDALPELAITVVGEVRTSNLATWRDVVIARVQAINTDLQTDDDFARAETTVKWLGECEERLKLVRDQILAQTGSIDETLKAIGSLGEEMRAKRLTLTQLTSKRKEDIRGEIVQKAKDALAKHIAGLNERWAEAWMPQVLTDFAGAIKGKKTVKGVRDATDAELTRATLEANRIADLIDKNLRASVADIRKYPVLFSDLRSLVLKAPDDFAAAVHKRIADHEAAEKRRVEAAATQTTQQAPATAHTAETGIHERLAIGSPQSGSPQAAGPAAALNPAAAWPFPASREQLVAALIEIIRAWETEEGDDVSDAVERAKRLLGPEFVGIKA